jgi:hypothetical protein
MYHLIDNYIITLKKYRSLTRISGNLIAIINRLRSFFNTEFLLPRYYAGGT